MGIKNPTHSVRVTVTGVNLTAGATSSSAPLPLDSAGNPPEYVRVAMTPSTACHIRFGGAAVAAVATDTLINGTFPEVFNTSGCTHVAVIQETVGGMVNVVPLAW